MQALSLRKLINEKVAKGRSTVNRTVSLRPLLIYLRGCCGNGFGWKCRRRRWSFGGCVSASQVEKGVYLPSVYMVSDVSKTTCIR
jgi:hypothetical protein